MTALDEGHLALASGNWRAARDAFAREIEERDSPEAHEGLAQASWWLDDAPVVLSSRERAYRLYRGRDDQVGAARAATALAWDCVLFGVGGTVAAGWLGRACSLLEGVPEQVEHGWLAVRTAELALGVDQDPAAALTAALQAQAIGQRFGDDDLQIVGLALEGLARVDGGDIDLGMRTLDEAVAGATAGDVSDLMWMGKVCCFLIAACNGARDIGRAAEWCERVTAICIERDLDPLFTVCRTQYAAVLVARGTWGEAERELDAVMTNLDGSRRKSLADAAVQLGELRRRQGRFDEAESLFAHAEFHPLAVVGRGEILLARGDAAGAVATAGRLLERIPDDNRLMRVRALELTVRAALRAGRRPVAAHAAEELRATAEATGTDPLLGSAAYADGLLAAPDAAIAPLEEAVRRFVGSGLRHDAAAARVALARALLTTGARTAATEQAQIAVRELDDLAATTDLRLARALVADLAGEDPGPLTTRERDVLRLVADGLSNREIATRLVLSSHTVHRHVANILRKLDEPSRAAAVAHATRLGLL